MQVFLTEKWQYVGAHNEATRKRMVLFKSTFYFTCLVECFRIPVLKSIRILLLAGIPAPMSFLTFFRCRCFPAVDPRKRSYIGKTHGVFLIAQLESLSALCQPVLFMRPCDSSSRLCRIHQDGGWSMSRLMG